jgi:broad specificity phosphatase PhoE
MTTFLLIRHGQTDAVGKVMAGWAPGWHLNAAGELQAKQLAQRLSGLPIRAIYSSPLERALETAAPIAETHGLAPETVAGLGELHVGEWQGTSFEELEKQSRWRDFNSTRGSVRAPGGELMLETQVRMVQEMERMAQRHDGELVAVVSHGDPLRSVIAHALGISLDLMLRFEISPGSVSVLEWGGAPRVLCLNSTGELPL